MAEMTETSAERQYRKMTQTPVTKLVLRLGLPTTLSMLVTNIYNMADTYFVSELGNSASGAIGVVFALMAIIQAFGFMYGHGAGSNISRLLGNHDIERARTFSTTSLYIGTATGVLIAVFGLAFQTPFMRLLGSTETILPYAKDYSRYILMAAPFMVAGCIMNNILRYEGKATYAMAGLVSGGLLNILGDFLLVKVFELGVSGAGIATAISQVTASVILFIPFVTGRVQSRFTPKYFTPEKATIFSIIAVGLPSLMRQGLNSISTMILNKQAAPYGDEAIAALSIVTRAIGFMFCIGLGVGQGFQPVCAFNYGARRYSRSKKAFRFTLLFGTVLLGVIAAAGFIFAEPVVRFFRDDATVVEIGALTMRLQSISLIFLPTTVCGNMLFQSVGKSGRATFLAATRSGLFFIPVVLILSNTLGLLGIQSSQAIADVISAVVTIPMVAAFLRSLPADGEQAG